MRRRLFTLASAASLVLCVATGVLWVRNYGSTDFVRWPKVTAVPGQGFEAASAR